MLGERLERAAGKATHVEREADLSLFRIALSSRLRHILRLRAVKAAPWYSP
jgi:hypothetical protein